MNEQNFLENEIIILTKQTLDVFLRQKNPMELIGVYSFYYYTAKWQKTNRIKCTTSYVAQGLNISEAKVRTVKKQLIELGLIEDVKTKNESNRITGHYIKINYVFKKETLEKLEPPSQKSTGWNNPQCGVEQSMENQQTNALSADNTNALSSVNTNALNADNEIQAEFETLWKLYPNKKGKDKALSCYKKARKRKNKPATYEQVKRGIENYCAEIKLKKTEKKYIKYGSTWFNGECWKDEYETSVNSSKNEGWSFSEEEDNLDDLF